MEKQRSIPGVGNKKLAMMRRGIRVASKTNNKLNVFMVDGSWVVASEGIRIDVKKFDTKRGAIRFASSEGKRIGSSIAAIVVHKKDGTIENYLENNAVLK